MHSEIKAKVTRDTDAWEAVVEAEIPAETLARYRAETLKEIRREATLDGFRKGHAPENEIVRVWGEAAIMRRAAEHAVQHELPEILAREKQPIVETPRVTTEAPAAGSPLRFTARASLAPEIELPDYTAIAAQHRKNDARETVSDQEYGDAITHLRRERTRIDKLEAGVEPQKAAEESRAMEEKDLPALDDEFAKSIGYESVGHFETAVRTNMKTEKERQAADVRRQAMLDALVERSRISYPKALDTYELDDMEARLADDLARAGTTLDAYLTETKKTRDELRAGWREAAAKRAKTRLVLSEIARKETIEPDAEALAKEVEHAKKHYPQADYDVLRAHIAHALRNDAVLKFLESV